jgi:predicted transcriptional regulator
MVNVIDCIPGQLIAFWAKVGMRSLLNLADVPVWIEWQGETRDTGKGNPMKVFVVSSKTTGNLLKCNVDNRKKSKTTKHFFETDSP